MSRLALLALTLAACNQWARPNPPAPVRRSVEQQWQAAVKVESTCDPFNDGGRKKVGSGVMVSDWQVLTALHVVDCQSAIARIWVTNLDGRRWKFAPEREWVFSWLTDRDGVARIQMNSAETLRPRLSPPLVRTAEVMAYDQLYIEASHPEKAEYVGEATGWAYGGAEYGGRIFTYKAWSEEGNSGSGIYDLDGDLVGVHLGVRGDGWLKYGAIVTPEMLSR